jgi:uncharacterized membrane protein
MRRMATRTFITPLRALTARATTAAAVFAGLAAWLLLRILANEFLPVTRILIAWDIGVAVYLAAVFWRLHGASAQDMARHAANHRAGRHFVLAVSVVSVFVSLAVIVFQIRSINAEPDALQGVRVAFVLVTVALSWVFVHTSFATHYAFEYYGAREGETGHRGGLMFPGEEDPDFWDVWHFSVVIGLTAQTADVAISSRSIRRAATIHGVISFLFNTVILAAAINFAAAFFRPGG